MFDNIKKWIFENKISLIAVLLTWLLISEYFNLSDSYIFIGFLKAWEPYYYIIIVVILYIFFSLIKYSYRWVLVLLSLFFVYQYFYHSVNFENNSGLWILFLLTYQVFCTICYIIVNFILKDTKIFNGKQIIFLVTFILSLLTAVDVISTGKNDFINNPFGWLLGIPSKSLYLAIPFYVFVFINFILNKIVKWWSGRRGKEG